GLVGGGWSGLGCGRSTWILCASTGAVIMKMISSTSITSTNGVTLISDIGALVLAVKDISLPLRRVGGHEADMDHARVLGVTDDLFHDLELGVLVRADLQFRLGRLL